jgi:hypothetical protein
MALVSGSSARQLPLIVQKLLEYQVWAEVESELAEWAANNL